MKVMRCMLVFILLPWSLGVFGQANRANITGAYVYNFARHIQWPSASVTDSFRMVVMASDPGLIEEFKKLAKNRTIHQRPISLYFADQVEPVRKVMPNLVFLSNDRNNLFRQVYERFLDQPVLIVTENLSNRTLTMINLYDSPSGELLFEVNKANIVKHNLVIDPNLLLSGGSEIDVVELYRNLQETLELEQKRIERLNDSLLALRSDLQSSFEKLSGQQKGISQQESLLVRQERQLLGLTSEVEDRKKEITEQKTAIAIQSGELEMQKSTMEKQAFDIKHQLDELKAQKDTIEKQQMDIQNSQETLNRLAKDISSKNIELSEQSGVISRQKSVMGLILVAALLVLAILIILYLAFLGKKKSNLILKRQKEEIEKVNSQIRMTNQKLFNTIVQLKETQSQLVSSEKMASLGVLTAGIAHEINNPVNFIYTGINSLKKEFADLVPVFEAIGKIEPNHDNSMFVDQLLELKREIDIADINEVIFQTIDDIKTGAERTADIVRGLRNFSRVDKDAMTQADVHEGIESSLLLLRNRFKQNIRVVKNYSVLPKIECFPGKLNQALLNILANAIDAIEGEGIITINTSFDGKLVKIEVIDTGTGMPSGIIDKIFDPFFTTKSVGKGVGLGLSITFGIIKEHNGSIDVRSEEGKGTCMTIWLPAAFPKDA